LRGEWQQSRTSEQTDCTGFKLWFFRVVNCVSNFALPQISSDGPVWLSPAGIRSQVILVPGQLSPLESGLLRPTLLLHDFEAPQWVCTSVQANLLDASGRVEFKGRARVNKRKLSNMKY
jgi:hypothetical protein